MAELLFWPALLAYGAWTPKGGEFESWRRGGLYARLLSATPEAARLHWGLDAETEINWRNWTVLGPVGQVLERAAFDHAVADTQLRDWILSRAQDAQSHWNVNVTPSFLIDGKLYEGAMAASDFAALLNG